MGKWLFRGASTTTLLLVRVLQENVGVALDVIVYEVCNIDLGFLGICRGDGLENEGFREVGFDVLKLSLIPLVVRHDREDCFTFWLR